MEEMVAQVNALRRPTKKEQEDAKKKAEQEEKIRKEDAERRIKEDKIIEQIEKDFWDNNKKMQEGTLPPLQGEQRSGPGIPVAAPSLDALISDDDLDRLVKYFEDGNSMQLEPRSALPGVDQETLERAQQMVETITRSLEEGDQRRASRAAAQRDALEEEKEAISRGEGCELERMLRKKMELEATSPEPSAQCSEVTDKAIVRDATPDAPISDGEAVTAPECEVELVEEAGKPARVVIKVALPLVASASDIDAEIVKGEVFELTVPGLYALQTTLPTAIDEDRMSCKFDKKKRVLTVKVPVM